MLRRIVTKIKAKHLNIRDICCVDETAKRWTTAMFDEWRRCTERDQFNDGTNTSDHACQCGITFLILMLIVDRPVDAVHTIDSDCECCHTGNVSQRERDGDRQNDQDWWIIEENIWKDVCN